LLKVVNLSDKLNTIQNCDILVKSIRGKKYFNGENIYRSLKKILEPIFTTNLRDFLGKLETVLVIQLPEIYRRVLEKLSKSISCKKLL
jgi:hypothetical protein